MEHKVTLDMDGDGIFEGWCSCGDRSYGMHSRVDALVYATFHLAVVGQIELTGGMQAPNAA